MRMVGATGASTIAQKPWFLRTFGRKGGTQCPTFVSHL
jgi:hypothetical protein